MSANNGAPVRVSVVIPCYKDSKTLAYALDSIRLQTRPVDEIIVVNDCSPETTAVEQVLLDYPEVRYLKNEENKGLAATRNIGVAAATGDVVAFLDADDAWHPQKNEMQCALMGTGIAVSCRYLSFESPPVINALPRYGPGLEVSETRSSKLLAWFNTLTGASLMISRDALVQAGGFEESLRSCEDYDLWLRLVDSGTVVKHIKSPLYLYRQNELGLSKNCENISYWELQVLRRYFNRNGQEFPRESLPAFIWTFWLMRHLARAEKNGSIALRRIANENARLLVGHPGLRFFLWLLDRSRVFKLRAMISARLV